MRAGSEFGINGVAVLFRHKFRSYLEKRAYRLWLKSHGSLDNETRDKHRRSVSGFIYKPLISIILPVFDIEEKWLRQAIGSVRRQLYENWELCIADDCSMAPHVRTVLEEYRDLDPRVKVVFRSQNGHIAAASNSALELATGDFAVLLDHDDELSEDALFYVAKEINDHPDVRMIYSDEDLIDTNGRRYGPKFKPDWSRDLFYSANLITHLSAYATSVLREIGGFTVGLEGSQDYDLALRVVERIDESQIRHIPKILYHWRVIETSVASGGEAKPYAHQAARDAIAAHLERMGRKATVTKTVHNLHRVHYELPEPTPLVSLILLSDTDIDFTVRSVAGFASNTGYPNMELIIVCAEGYQGVIEKRLESFAGGENAGKFARFSVLGSDKAGVAAKLNLGASSALGEVICFADANLKPIGADWLGELVSFALQDEIGAVGAKLLYPNGTILHGGLLIGVGSTVGVAHHKWPAEADGNITRIRLIGNYSAVSASCLAVRKVLFEDFEGFNDADFPDRLFDADFCLRLGKQGFRIVWTPYARLVQTDKNRRLNPEEPVSTSENESFKQRWQEKIEYDPFYNPNLKRDSGDFSVGPDSDQRS